MYRFNVRDINFYPGNPIVLIAGPCVIESEGHALFMADKLKALCKKLRVPYIFKSSFLKANRSSADSYVGPGLDKGLDILEKVKREISVPVISDVHSVEQIDPVSSVLDVIQIPAFLCRQTQLIVDAAKTNKIINIKKGQFLAPWDIKNVIQKVLSTGNEKVLITERGSTFGYNNLVVDMRSLDIIKRFGVPVVFDATHSVQLPGGQGICSGGQREFVGCLARAAVSIGINALFLEVHDKPEIAKCDGPNMITFQELEEFMPLLLQIDGMVKKESLDGKCY
ncbi:MAG: 3-deoxy-8-phosphooctulonate synthase [Thermodesulfobacteriota bacterium]|nr:3-deoxy-8-phosphooctulonate synthase [Thermodesulfobacteriota bacterium]